MLRSTILAAARSSRLEKLVATAPISRGLINRYIAGTTTADAVDTTKELVDDGLKVTLDYLGEDTLTLEQAEATRDEYLQLLDALAAADLTANAEISVKLSALGQLIDESTALQFADELCAAADKHGTTVTIDMEDHTSTDATLDVIAKLRETLPSTGVVLQSYLRRTEADCKEFATSGSRVRLCKGAYAEPESVAYQSRIDIDRSYVRCMNVLMRGAAYPMLATHDPRLIEIGIDRAKWYDRPFDSFEFQMLYGIRPQEQKRLADAGHQVRVYVPFGEQSYGYLMRRLAERPANLGFFLKSLSSKK